MTKLKSYFLHEKDWQLNTLKLIKIIDTTITVEPMITFDSSLSFNQQVMNTHRPAFYELRWISSIRKYLTIDATTPNCVF